MDPPPPSEPAAFKDLGEPSSPESRLHMLYVPNARGGSRSWTGRVETWLEGSYRNRTAGIDDRNPVRGSGFFPTPFLFYFEFFDSFDFFLFFFEYRFQCIELFEEFLIFFFYRNWKSEKKVDSFFFAIEDSFIFRRKFQVLFSREWILEIWRGVFYPFFIEIERVRKRSMHSFRLEIWRGVWIVCCWWMEKWMKDFWC